MTKSTGQTGRGASLEISDGNSPTAFIPIANLVDTGITGRSTEEIDFTILASTGGFREKRAGFKDPGNIPFTMHFTPTEPSHVALLNDWISGAEFQIRIVYPVSNGHQFAEYGSGYVANPGDITINLSDPIRGAGTFRLSGGTQIVQIS